MVEKPDAGWLEPPRFTAAEYSSMGHSFGMEMDAAREGEEIDGVGDWKPFGGREAAVRHLEQLDLDNAPPEARQAWESLRLTERVIARERDDDDRER